MTDDFLRNARLFSPSPCYHFALCSLILILFHAPQLSLSVKTSEEIILPTLAILPHPQKTRQATRENYHKTKRLRNQHLHHRCHPGSKVFTASQSPSQEPLLKNAHHRSCLRVRPPSPRLHTPFNRLRKSQMSIYSPMF